MYTRRRLLGALSVSVAAAGCTGSYGDEGNGSTDADSVRLDNLSVENGHDEYHRLQLAIEAGGEMLHLGTYQLPVGESRTIEGEWGETSGSYRIHAKLDDAEIRTADVTEGIKPGTDCVRVLLRIDDSGELAVWNGANCGPDAEDPELNSA